MKPACAQVVRAIRAGRLPTVLEYGSLLYEAGFGQAEAQDLFARYKSAVSGRSSAEDEFILSLKSFAISHG